MVNIVKEIVIKKVQEIQPYWRNPRKNDRTVEALCKIIPIVGFNVPIVIDKEGVIIKGHARYRACIQLGMTEVPCVVSENDEETNRIDRVADNKMSELAEWDMPELRYELEQINFPLEEIGFDIPKNDFMETTYEQHEYSGVSEEDFKRAAAKIMDSQQSSRDDLKSAFSTSDDIQGRIPDDVGSTLPTRHSHLIKMKCPHCGEEFIYESKD